MLARSLPDRAAITDAIGRPAVHARPRWSTSASTPRKVTDLPALAAGLSAATGVAADRDHRPYVQKAKPASSSRSSRCAGPTSRRSGPRSSTCPGAVFPTVDPAARAHLPVRRRAARPGRRRPPRRCIKETEDHGRPRYAATDQLGLSGLQRAFQEQLTGTPGFTVSVVSTDKSTGDTGPADRRGRARARHARADDARPRRCRTPPTPPSPPSSCPPTWSSSGPGTGEILAVSSNAAADPGNALGRPLPARLEHEDDDGDGAAAGRQGHPDHPGALSRAPPTVDGREFENENKFDLGTVPLHRRRSRSRATPPSSSRRMTLPDDALAAAAHSYGVGTDWKLPVGIFSGSVPGDSTGTTKAADAIGQGQVLMSPAALALVAAGIASGKPAAPVEVVGAAPAGPAPSRARRRRCSTRCGR